MSYKLDLSDDALSMLEDCRKLDAKRMVHIFIEVLSLMRNPGPQGRKELNNFIYAGFKGFRLDQEEYRIIYAVDEKNKTVKVGHILNRNEEYKDLKHKNNVHKFSEIFAGRLNALSH